MARRFTSLVFVVLAFAVAARAQSAEVKISLSEQFFNALLEAVFTNLEPPAFPIGQFQNPNSDSRIGERRNLDILNSNAFTSDFNSKPETKSSKSKTQNSQCAQSIKLQREIGGVRTAVRFRERKIYAPIAFTGAYNAPLVGCLEFRGWAETTVDLEFDGERQILLGRARVLNVRLEGVPNLAGGVLTPVVQSAIDRRVNPIRILPLEKVSFVVPVENAGALRMRATNLRHEIEEGVLNVYVKYEFAKNN